MKSQYYIYENALFQWELRIKGDQTKTCQKNIIIMQLGKKEMSKLFIKLTLHCTTHLVSEPLFSWLPAKNCFRSNINLALIFLLIIQSPYLLAVPCTTEDRISSANVL